MDIPRKDFLEARRKRRIVFGTVGGLALAGVACAIVTLDPVARSVERGDLLIDTVQHGEFVRQVRGPGVLVPQDSRSLAAQAAGRVERILLKPGRLVQPGSIIATLVNPELERVVQEAQWALAQGEAEVAAVKLQLQSQVLDQKSRLAEARATYESTRLQAEAEEEAARIQAVSQLQARRSRIMAQQLADRLQVEEDRLANLREATQAQLRAQAAHLEQLRNALERQRQALDSLQVRAGMTGVVQAVPVQVGQQVAAGAPIARVAQLDKLIAELRIPEVQAKDLAVGQKAQIDLRTGIALGEVTRVDPAVENGTVKVDVELVGKLPGGARPDLSVDGVIEIERCPDALYVARPAAGEPETHVSLFKLDAAGSRAHRAIVKLGKASVSQIQVVAGLSAGDQVIVSDVSQWSASDELRIR